MDNKPVLRIKKPLILRKANMTILNGNGTFTPNVSFFREDVIHDTSDVYFLKGEFQRMILVNRLNIVNQSSRTVAKYFSKDGSVLEKTSDRVIQVIGQEQYRTIFTALCSILDQDLKIRSLMALLTAKGTDIKSAEVDKNDTEPRVFMETSCQTDEMRIDFKSKPRKRIKKPNGPYIVQDSKIPEKKKVKKVVINIAKDKIENSNLDKSKVSTEKEVTSETFNNFNTAVNTDSCAIEPINKGNFDTEKNILRKGNSTECLQDLGYLHDEYSNDSTGKLSALSDTLTLPELLTNPTSIINPVVDQHTKEVYVQDFIEQPYRIPGTNLYVPHKPEDMFHLATKDTLQYLDKDDRVKLLKHQMAIDYKYCLTPMDEDGNLLIHQAVLNNDLGLLIRQCEVLKLRGSSVDVTAKGTGLTALKLSLFAAAALGAALVRCGADPLRADAGLRGAAHHAAERGAAPLAALLRACRQSARRILSESEELWKPGMESQTDEELATYLMKHMCSTFDKAGYTPLMLACTLGLYENVRILLEQSPSSVYDRMPTSGNTALFLAVAAASNSSAERGNKSQVVDHFRKTIEILMEYGADPTIDNDSGSNVNTLLQEFNCAELSMLVANKLTREYFSKQKDPEKKDCGKVMLVMDKEGNVACKALENDKKKKSHKNSKTEKPVIVENILLKPPGNIAKKSTSAGKSPRNNQLVNKSTKMNDKVDLKQIVITGNKQHKTPVKVESKNVTSPAAPLSQGKLKRKILDAPKVMKQTKIDK